MKYKEWEHLETTIDKDNPLVDLYHLETGEEFFIEPAFYTQFTYLKSIYSEHVERVVEEMNNIVRRNKKVIFCHDYEHPLIIKDDFIYLEIEDVLNPLGIFVEDKSRGSDYGD